MTAQSRRVESALRAVVAASRGGEPWARALRGALRAREGDLEGALALLSEALAGERIPWALAERAEVLNRLGRFPQALRDLRRLARLEPASAGPWALAAAVHLDQAQYPQAAECLGRALRIAPRDPELWRRRAHAYFVQGDLLRARRCARRAVALRPRDLAARREALRLDILCGGGGRLPPGFSAAEAAFWRAYRLCRRRRRAEAARLFERAAKDPSWAPRARFYARVCRALAVLAAVPAARGRELVIMGLGYRQPYQVSLETVAWLDSCDLLFSNLSDPTVAEFLGLFPVRARTIVFRRQDRQSTACAREVMEAFRRAQGTLRVGMVTRGNPLFYGRLAWRLIRDSRRRGIPCRVLGSISIAETVTALSPAKAPGGVEVRDSSLALSWDARLPLVVYNFPSDGRAPVCLAGVAAACRPAHRVLLLPGSGDREFTLRRTTVAGLARALRQSDPAVTVLVPPARRP